MSTTRFRKAPVKNYADALEAAGSDRYESLFCHLINSGIYLPPADLESFFVSCMHTKKDLGQLANELKNYFSQELVNGKKQNEVLSKN